MGGSGSSGYTPTSSIDKCETLSFDTQVNSPQPMALQTLVIGDHLTVSLSPLPRQVVQVDKDGVVVGAITGPDTPKLISCLQNGYTFKAEVLEVAGGMCTVRVTPS